MKQSKRLLTYGGLFTVLTLFLSACSNQQIHRTPPTGFLYGPIYKFLGLPMQHLITWIAKLFGNPPNYGWAILIITLVVRLILLPLMLSQSKKSTRQQQKMAAIKPQMDDIQKRQKAAQTNEERTAISQEMMTLYKDNGVSMTGGIGCLPLLIQLPVFSALYMAIQYDPVLFKSTFMGISLGQTNLVITILATLTYVIQGYISLIGLPESQKQQMKTMMLMSPAMTFFISLASPAGLGLYFLAGGLLAILQTVITNFYYMPKIKAEVAEELKKNPPKQVVKPVEETAKPAAKPKKVAAKSNTNSNQKNRNSGKQHHER
ncbi:membrane protein insertase YidC [Loigolactobacillus iwatensis]|uniref:membrane protein insertase YidC n=1 Tax=Loigolactobacillus iwatensis TaxID=1267156 RepID=UPI000F7E84F2|nr:membrane protein insertase YidC [Loigolactobacillus iwatensis]